MSKYLCLSPNWDAPSIGLIIVVYFLISWETHSMAGLIAKCCKTAQSLKLRGKPDWSEKIDQYM